jgi:carbonic anhydrase/acetyltransferase-like protein (isoleucine patch superfamily)
MIYRNHAGDKPIVHATATIHPSAVVIGNVQIGEKVFVGPNAVIRADEPCPEGNVEAIVIASEVNIQDGVIIHALGGSPVHVGNGVSLAHGAVIHGPCHIGDNCFVGFKSVVFKARLGEGVVIQHQALVEGVDIPAGMHVPSMAGVLTEADVHVLGPVTPELSEFAEKVRKTNVFLAEVAADDADITQAGMQEM